MKRRRNCNKADDLGMFSFWNQNDNTSKSTGTPLFKIGLVFTIYSDYSVLISFLLCVLLRIYTVENLLIWTCFPFDSRTKTCPGHQLCYSFFFWFNIYYFRISLSTQVNLFFVSMFVLRKNVFVKKLNIKYCLSYFMILIFYCIDFPGYAWWWRYEPLRYRNKYVCHKIRILCLSNL